MRRLVFRALCLLLALASCSTDRKLVAQVASEVNYHKATFTHNCQGTGNPPAECKRCKDAINYAEWQSKVAEQNKEMGYLTPAQKYALKQIPAELAPCP